MGRSSWRTASLVWMVLALSACLHHVERKSGPRLRDIDARASVIKLHLASGELYVLSTWSENSAAGTIIGQGQRWDPARQLVADGQQRVRLRDVVIFETSSERSSIGPNVVLGGLTTLTVAAAAVLITFIAAFAGSDGNYR